MTIFNTNYSKIELVDGVFYLKLNNGTKINIFLYKFMRIDNCTTPEDVFNTSFDYDLVILDKNCEVYMYFTYNYVDEPEEIF